MGNRECRILARPCRSSICSGHNMQVRSADIKDAVQIQKQHGTLISRLMDINKNTKITTLLFFVSLLSVFGCRPKEYEYVRAYVYETKTYPLRDNYFKMNISYEFEYKGDTIRGVYSTHKLPVAQKGDSLVLKYPIGKPEKNEVVSVVKVVKGRIQL